MTRQPETRTRSRAPGDLRPALRDPVPTEVLRSEYRERARLPASQRFALPLAHVEPEPLPLDGVVWNEPASYEQGKERMENLRARIQRYDELILAEKQHDRPDKNYLLRMGREKFRVQERMAPLRTWLNARAVEERDKRVAATLGGDPTPERLLASLYTILDGRINGVPEGERVVTEQERRAMSATRRYLKSLGLDPLTDKPKGAVV